MRWNMKVLGLLFIVAILGGCATIFSGTSEDIKITTTPDDAMIYLNDRLLGQGEVITDVPREYANNSRPYIKVAKEGYQTQEFQLTNKFNSVSIINLSAVYSWTTDFLSGAMFKYAPNAYHVQLVKEGTAGSTPTKYTLERYVLVNYEVIMTDLAKGYGEHFATLTEFGSTPSETARILHENKASLLKEGEASPLALSNSLQKLIF